MGYPECGHFTTDGGELEVLMGCPSGTGRSTPKLSHGTSRLARLLTSRKSSRRIPAWRKTKWLIDRTSEAAKLQEDLELSR
jgi:hypothetical protein